MTRFRSRGYKSLAVFQNLVLVGLAGILATLPAMAGTVGTTAVVPNTASVGVATTVTVTSLITDPSLIAGSVQLQSLNGSGQVVAVVGTLHDDGLNGDAEAGDNIYSLQTTVFQNTPGTVTFRVSAGFKGSLLRAFSSPVVVTVSGSAIGVSISAPANLLYTNISPVNVTGTVGDPSATVKINGIVAPVTGQSFLATVPLVEGLNTLTAVASNSGGTVSTASVQVTLDTTPPHITVDSPLTGTSTTAASLTVTGTANDIVVGTVNSGDVQITVNGVPAQVANRTYSAANVSLVLGPNTIQVVGRDRAGNGTTVSAMVTRVNPAQPPMPTIGMPVITDSLNLVSGNNQTGTIGTALSAPLVVSLVDQKGNAVAGQPVVFSVTGNNGTLASGGVSAKSVKATTDANGRAQAVWTLGQRSGAGIDTVQASTVLAVAPVGFTATSLTSGAKSIVVDSGNNQSGALGQPLAFPLVAVVTDVGHNRVPNVPVTFNVTKGGGTLNGGTSQQVLSDQNGRAIAVLTLGDQPGNDNNVVQASFAGNPSLPVVFSASALAPGNPANTIISGIVLDNSNAPIQNVTMRLYLTNQASNNNLPLQIGTPVQTDAKGMFQISPAPVGFYKLMADGSTAISSNSYPTLEYDIVTVAGQNNTLGTPIFLPALDTTNRLCVTPTVGGTLTLPQSPGFSLTVAPGAAIFPGGATSGCVSVSAVHGDKVPMAPGFGQQPRFIVTIQPVGTIFNPPAAITLPNVDGLKPGAITEMYSYDHDLSMFVAIGTATVSADGSVIASNPGVGVLKAGWHCGGDPDTAGTVADCPICNICNGVQCVADPSQDGNPTPDNQCLVCMSGVPTQVPDGIGVQTTYTLANLSKLIQTVNSFFVTIGISDKVTLPDFGGELQITTTPHCCEDDPSGQKKKVEGSLTTDLKLPRFVPTIPPWSGTYPPAGAPPITFFGVTLPTISYGLGITVSADAEASISATTTCSEPTEWEGTISAGATLMVDIFGEIDNPVVPMECGPQMNMTCALVKVSGGATTGLSLGAKVTAKEIDVGELDWAGLTLGTQVNFFEGTFASFDYSYQFVVFKEQTIGTAYVIPLPAL